MILFTDSSFSFYSDSFFHSTFWEFPSRGQGGHRQTFLWVLFWSTFRSGFLLFAFFINQKKRKRLPLSYNHSWLPDAWPCRVFLANYFHQFPLPSNSIEAIERQWIDDCSLTVNFSWFGGSSNLWLCARIDSFWKRRTTFYFLICHDGEKWRVFHQQLLSFLFSLVIDRRCLRSTLLVMFVICATPSRVIVFDLMHPIYI